MEETEVPLEQAQEEIHHHAEHVHHEGGPSWISKVALTSALLAALAAVAALLSGHHANEAMIEQIRASDSWNYYQAKGIKAAVLKTRVSVLQALGKGVPPRDEEKLKSYGDNQLEISDRAREEEAAADRHLMRHQILARAVTLFQVAIAVCAISVLARRRRYWGVGMVFGGIGLVFFIQGLFP